MPSVQPHGITLEFGRAIPRQFLIPGSDCCRSFRELEQLILGCTSLSLPPPPAVLPAGGGDCPHILELLVLLDAPRADIRLLLQKGRAEHPLLPGTFSAEVSVILPAFQAIQAERICPHLPASLAHHFKPRILQDSFHSVLGEEQGKYDLLHGCIYKSQCIIPAGKSRLYWRLPAYITWETLLTFSFWKLLMLKDWNISLPFLDKNVAHWW